MTELGGGVDELEVDLLLSAPAGLDQQRLEAQSGFRTSTHTGPGLRADA